METWLLIAFVTLRSGESADLLISSHAGEAQCIAALWRTPPRAKRRLDCRPVHCVHSLEEPRK